MPRPMTIPAGKEDIPVQVTQAMKKLIGRLSQNGFSLRAYQSRAIGTDQWQAHGCYLIVGPKIAGGRSPDRSMVEHMEQAGLILWQEKTVETNQRRALRCLQSVLTAKAMKMHQAAVAKLAAADLNR